jgi:hypothetical protein
MFKRFLCLALLIGITSTSISTTSGSAAIASTADGATLEKEFSDPLEEIFIDNRAGATEAETWAGETIKVVATRRNGSENLDSEVSFERPQATTLKVSVRPGNKDRRIGLKIFVPSRVRLLVKGSREPVVVKGQTNGLSVETDSGDITLYLSRDSNALLSLRAPQGSINLKVPITVFGVVDSAKLDGRVGQGGPGVVLRSL